MAEELAGRVAVVTGGGRGIGRAIALALAAAGAGVAVVARSQEQVDETALLIERAGGRALAVPADVTDRFGVEWMAAEAERRLGPIDVLVNCAGVSGPVGPLWENDPNEWRRCLEINVNGPFLCAHAVLPRMLARGRGCIITLVSTVALQPYPYLSAYNVAKTAVIRMSETLAAEAREHGIAVFAISPGLVRTDMSREVGSSEEGRTWLPTFAAAVEARGQSPDRAAALCVALAAGAADSLSGCYLSVDDDLGGLLSQVREIQNSHRRTLRVDR